MFNSVYMALGTINFHLVKMMWVWYSYNSWGALAKSCLIALVALVFVHSMRKRASAATRHLILTSATIAILILPLLSALPSWELAQIKPIRPPQVLRIPIGTPVKLVITYDKTGMRQVSQTFSRPTPSEWRSHSNFENVETSFANGQRQDTVYSSAYIPPIGIAFSIAQIASIVLIVRMALMLIGLTRLAGRSQPADASMREYLPKGMGRVRIRFGGETPMTWGWLRPILLLPEEAAQWPTERLRAVIQHECAHIARFDWLTQTLTQFLCAMCCINPLIWVLARKMRQEAELACDDAVLLAGMPAPDYASHLLDVARLLKIAKRKPAGVVAMASRSEVGSRLAAILDRSRPRELADAPARLDNLCAAVIILLALGTCNLRVVRSQPFLNSAAGAAAGKQAQTPAVVRGYRILMTSDPTLFDIDYGKPMDPPIRSITRHSQIERNGLHTFFVEIPTQELIPNGSYRLAAIGKDGKEMPVKFGGGKFPTSSMSDFVKNKYSLFVFVALKKDLPLKKVQELRFETPDSSSRQIH
ncbi:MAG: TonB family protein [Capsulimonas sp.]|jgi:beta-lactamase regulating signal transducer with metallopeptidase domain|nr:TonB family protein [Capsulimonas sp.]